MEHCRWWSQCKTFHEYKCFEPDWPSRDCDCACVYVCVLFFQLCTCVSIQQQQQLHSISLLLQNSQRSSGSNTHTNQTSRCVGGHFEPTVSRAWAAAEKMSRHDFRGGPSYTWPPLHPLHTLSVSRFLALLCRSCYTPPPPKQKKSTRSQWAATKTWRWRRGEVKTHEGGDKP